MSNQSDLFSGPAGLVVADGVPQDHVHRIRGVAADMPGRRDKPLPFSAIVSTRICPRRPEVVVAGLTMFDGHYAELEVFEAQKSGRPVQWGGFWSYVPQGFPEFLNGGWCRGDPTEYGVRCGVEQYERDHRRKAIDGTKNSA
jgi:hypothetical protein